MVNAGIAGEMMFQGVLVGDGETANVVEEHECQVGLVDLGDVG